MIHVHNSRNASGFTLVELMLAMTFVSVLLLAIAGIVIQIGGAYSRGNTMKSVNQAGRTIVDDMRRTISAGSPFTLSTSYNQLAGRLCTGTYSYIWNLGQDFDPSDPSTQHNKYAGTDSSKPLRFIRVRDSNGQYCADAASAVRFGDATELLSDGNLAVQNFEIVRTTNVVSTGVAVYSIQMVISDADQSSIYVNTVDDTACKPPTANGSSETDFCAVNAFDFTASAGNGGGV